MSPKPEPKSSKSPAAEAAPPPRAVWGYGGPGLVGMRVDVARMQADSAPQPPSATSSATSTEVSSPSSLESPETVQQEGRQTEEQQRKDEAAAGTGEGEDKGGQGEASGGRTEVVASEAEGQGEEKGKQAVVRRRADPFNLAESDRQGGWVVNDTSWCRRMRGRRRGGWQWKRAQGSRRRPMCWLPPRSPSSWKCRGRNRARVGQDHRRRD